MGFIEWARAPACPPHARTRTWLRWWSLPTGPSALQSSSSLMRSCFRSYQVWEPAAHNVLWWGTKDGERRWMEREKERERGWKWRQRNERGQTDAREIKEKKKFPISGVNDLLSSVCLNWCLCFRGSLCTSPVVSEEIFITGQGTRTRITSNQSHLKWWEQRGGTELLVAGHIISGTF